MGYACGVSTTSSIQDDSWRRREYLGRSRNSGGLVNEGILAKVRWWVARHLPPYMSVGTILLIILLLLLIGALPAWPHSRGWGYYPSGGLGLLLLIIIILLVMGVL